MDPTGVGRWLLLLYLPLLLPLVVLTLFTWPWRVIGHGLRGWVLSARNTWYGYTRSRQNHRRRPFSLWRNMFFGCWMELARQNELRHGPSLSVSPGVELAPAYQETLLEATKETQARICASLRASMTTHSIMAAFLFLALAQAVNTSSNSGSSGARLGHDHDNSAAADVCGLFAGLAFVISLAVAGVYHQLASLLSLAATPEQFYWFVCTWERAAAGSQLATASVITLAVAAGLAAAFALFSDWVFVVLLFTAATLLYGFLYFWADSMWCPQSGAYVHYSQAFHRELLGRETLQHPARQRRCCAFWDVEPSLALEAPGSLYDCMDRHLWRGDSYAARPYAGGGGGTSWGGDSMHQHPSSTELYKLPAGGRSSPKPAAASPAAATATAAGAAAVARPAVAAATRPAAAAAAAARPAVAAAAAGGGGSGSSGSSAVAGAAPAASGAGGGSGGQTATDPALYSSWPSLMRYTSSSTGGSRLQGRGKRNSGSGLQSVTEGSQGAARAGTGGMPV